MTPIRSFIAVLMVFVMVLCFSLMAAAAHTRSTQDSFAMSLAESPPHTSVVQNTYSELPNSIEQAIPLTMLRAGDATDQAQKETPSLDFSDHRSLTNTGAGHTEKTRLSCRSYRALRYT